jgi:DNA-binding GntR family transcriptional regulator
MGISRDSLRERIKKILLERIMDGHYPPDFQLKEVSLAEEFGTSPVPVREALRELSAMRILDSESYKGVHVRSFTDAEIRDAYEVRGVLEEFAGMRAARFFKNNVQPLKRFLEQMFENARENKVKDYLNHDLPFHRTIVKAADNVCLLRAWDELGFEIRAYLFLTRDNRDLPEIAEEHVAMVEALNVGDGKKAGSLLRMHCFRFAKEVMSMEARKPARLS